MKRITVEVDDETHAILVDGARGDQRSLRKYLSVALIQMALGVQASRRRASSDKVKTMKAKLGVMLEKAIAEESK